MTEQLPASVTDLGYRLAARTGLPVADALSFAAEAWWHYQDQPALMYTAALRDCYDEVATRAVHNTPERAITEVVERTCGCDELGYDTVENKLALADVLAILPDAELAAVARFYWLGQKNTDPVTKDRAIRHAKVVAAGGLPPQALTPRQRQVTALVAQGKSNKEIGVCLGIAENTVKTTLSNALRAADAMDRAHLTALAIRNHWID